jgi:hypothetical protein
MQTLTITTDNTALKFFQTEYASHRADVLTIRDATRKKCKELKLWCATFCKRRLGRLRERKMTDIRGKWVIVTEEKWI